MENQASHPISHPTTRRSFLQLAGGIAAAGIFSQAQVFEAHAGERPASLPAAARVEAEIRALRERKFSCSQATFLGICKALGSCLSEEEVLALSAGFAGGIGRTYNDGTCGALVAGVMAAGLYLPGQTEQAMADAKKLFEQFRQREESVICKDILKKYNGFAHCTDCCLNVARDVTAILQNRNANPGQQE